MAELKPRSKTIIYTVAALAVIAVAAVAIWYFLQPRYNLTAAYVTEVPLIDGVPNEAVWSKADPMNLPLKDGPDVEVRAVYTNEMVFLSAKYKDATKDAIEQIWAYDGKVWRNGRSADAIEVFFDIDGSVKNFASDGFGVMTWGLGANPQINKFGVEKNKSAKGMWPGDNARGDIWLVYPNTLLSADDLYFGSDKFNVPNTVGDTRALFSRWDESMQIGLTKINIQYWEDSLGATDDGPTLDQVALIKPYLTYIDSSQNTGNTPYPFEDQLVPISGTDVFKKGDKLPFVYFTRQATDGWGLSRGDVTGKMKWKDGWWTVEMARKLDTGNPDDIVFKPSNEKPVDFGLIIRIDGKKNIFTPPAFLSFSSKGG